MAIWLGTTDGNRYKLLQRGDETDDQIMRGLLDGTVSGWAPVATSQDQGWKLVNLAHVIAINTGPDESEGDSFR